MFDAARIIVRGGILHSANLRRFGTAWAHNARRKTFALFQSGVYAAFRSIDALPHNDAPLSSKFISAADCRHSKVAAKLRFHCVRVIRFDVSARAALIKAMLVESLNWET